MHDAVPLSLLLVGQVAEVRHVAGPAEQVRQLEELGLRCGAHIELIRGGSPCIVRIGSATLCLRPGELLTVLVAQRKTA